MELDAITTSLSMLLALLMQRMAKRLGLQSPHSGNSALSVAEQPWFTSPGTYTAEEDTNISCSVLSGNR